MMEVLKALKTVKFKAVKPTRVRSCLMYGRETSVEDGLKSLLDGCIVWNAHNTVFGWNRSAICA